MNLLKLEMMNGTERIAEALQMRGLFVEVNGDFIILTEGNTDVDVKKTKELLHSIGIPTFWQGNKFQVLVNRTPIVTMKEIINAPGREFPVSMEGYHFRWRAFAQRRFGIKVNALDLDANIAMLVKSLNAAGITSIAGCNGHNRYSPNIQLSGMFQGSWFKVIQEKYLNELQLHYRWNVHFGNHSGSCIRAEGVDRWDMNWVYQDTVQMAKELQKHEKEIRELKNAIFKRNKDMKKVAEKLVDERDFAGLIEWMKSMVELFSIVN
jgi:hypothetical protein